MPKQPAVYIETNHPNGTLYVGVTAYPRQRHNQHQSGKGSMFTRRYQLKTLVWLETHPNMESAILREKQLKSWSRSRKLALIAKANPSWQDLANELPY